MKHRYVLIFPTCRWTGPKDYFGDAYLTETGRLRIPFSINDSTLQQCCLDFDILQHLSGGTTHTVVFNLAGTPLPAHIERFEALLSRNRNWTRQGFSLAHDVPFRLKKRKYP